MSLSIPVRCFAVAADLPAKRFNEDVGEIFDCDAQPHSRARLVAIEALVRAFPGAPLIGVARGFGWTGSARQIWAARDGALSSAWWREASVDRLIDVVVDCVFIDLRWPQRAGDAAQRLAADQQSRKEPCVHFDRASGEILCLEKVSEPFAPIYEPRLFRPARVLQRKSARSANVTASVMGDPPKGRSALARRALEGAPA